MEERNVPLPENPKIPVVSRERKLPFVAKSQNLIPERTGNYFPGSFDPLAIMLVC